MAELSGALTQQVTVGTDAVWAELTPAPSSVTSATDLPFPNPRWRVVLRAGRDVDVGTTLWWRGRQLTVLSATCDPRTPDRLELLVEERR